MKGRLIASGAPGDSIVFTINDTTGWSTYDDPSGGWAGILFADSTGSMGDNDTSSLIICKISHTKNSLDRIYGGGIYQYNFRKLEIDGCYFANCHSVSHGGGIAIMDSYVRITNSTFTRCSALEGAAIYCENGSILLHSNIFFKNIGSDENDETWTTGCIDLQNLDTAIIKYNKIFDNQTSNNGGGIYFNGSLIIIENNEIYHNYARFDGGGIYLHSGTTAIINNNLIWGNHLTWGGGSGIYSGDFVHFTFRNNQIFDNYSMYYTRGGMRFDFHQLENGVVEFNQIHHNTNGGFTLSGSVSDSSLVISNNHIYENTSHGISIYYGNEILRENEIYNNYGYGIGLSYDETQLERNLIYGNTGRGIATIMNSAFISRNIITGNSGGGINIAEAYPLIVQNIIVNNEAKIGGAISIYDSEPLIINNTIYNNKATDPESGGAISIGIYCNPKFYNNIIYNNFAGTQANQISFRTFDAKADFYNCNIQGGEESFIYQPGSTHSGIYLDNIDIDPNIKEPSPEPGYLADGLNADWSLTMNSPCINKGVNSIKGFVLPEVDYAGNKRISFIDVDIGAYEYHDTVLEFCGPITENTIWAADTVKLCDDVIVEDGNLLRVLPGVCVQSQGQYGIQVEGTLLCEGVAKSPILFTAKDTTEFFEPICFAGGWSGIEFGAGSATDTSKIFHTIFEFCIGGAIMCVLAPKILISDCLFRWNRGGGGAIGTLLSPISIIRSDFINNFGFDDEGAISLERSDAQIVSCKFMGNSYTYGGAIFIWRCSPTITKCEFTNNQSSQGGGAIYAYERSSPVISHNLFQFNRDYSELVDWGGGAVYAEGGEPIISYNTIINNQAFYGGGLFVKRVDDKENPVISNNIFANNSATQGGAIYNSQCNMSLINNTIVNNHSIVAGGGIFTEGMAKQNRIYNSIIWGNETADLLNQIHIDYDKDTSNMEIYYSNIQGGILAITGSKPFIYENNLDSLPKFINPTINTGVDFLTTPTDWMLLSNSPSVNTGTNDISDLYVGDIDLLGNPRIHFSRIDMGAIENQSYKPEILKQPTSHIACVGEEIKLSIQVDDSVDYQWTYENNNILGANSSVLRIDSLTIDKQGNYQCIVKNKFGTVYSNPCFIQVKELPDILQNPQNTWAQENSTVSLEIFARGSDLKYQWQKDSLNLTFHLTPKLNIENPGLTDEGFYRCIIYNTCDTVTSENAVLYLAPQICMVTVDPLTGNNLVIWEKKSKAPISAYNVYRESKAAGIYDLMGTVTHNDLSIFVDTTADPMVQAYLYKITGVDTSDYETDIDLCKPHKTIHLLVSTNPELNTTQLEWDKYYGFSYQTYHIYRSPIKSDFIQIHSLSSSLSSWTDPDPLPDVGYYRIAVEKPNPCFPTGGSKKADAGPYSHSMSNMEDNRLQEVMGNQAPTDINLTDNTVAENQSIGTLVGRLETTDADTADHHTYKLVSGSGDTDNNRFTTLGDMLITAEMLDYETKDTLYVRIKSTDKGDLSFEDSFFILVTDVNEGAGNLAPTGITLNFNSIDENKPVGTMIGKLQTIDPNEDDMHTYGLVEGLGADDNNSFILLGDALLSGEQFDYETKGEYTIRIRSRDDGDGRLSFEKSFTIYVNDLLETGLTDNRIKNRSLDIYPNPFNNKTLIQFENPAGEKYRMYITDLTGKVVYFKDNIFTSHIEFNRRDLPDGCYFVELRGVKIFRGKIILE